MAGMVMMALNGRGLVWHSFSGSGARHQALLSTNTLLMASELSKWMGHLHSKVISVSTQGPTNATQLRHRGAIHQDWHGTGGRTAGRFYMLRLMCEWSVRAIKGPRSPDTRTTVLLWVMWSETCTRKHFTHYYFTISTDAVASFGLFMDVFHCGLGLRYCRCSIWDVNPNQMGTRGMIWKVERTHYIYAFLSKAICSSFDIFSFREFPMNWSHDWAMLFQLRYRNTVTRTFQMLETTVPYWPRDRHVVWKICMSSTRRHVKSSQGDFI